MNPFRFLRLPLALLLLLAVSAATARDVEPGRICSAVCDLLEQGHYSQRRIDPAMSRLLLKNYLDTLDADHLFFTQKDIDGLQTSCGAGLGNEILSGKLDSAYRISDLYRRRVEERVAKINELVKEPFDFKSERTAEVNRERAPWPKDAAEADRLWRDRIEGEFLDERLNEHAADPAPKVVAQRYDEILCDVRGQGREDVAATFLSVLAQTFDPHSDYLTKTQLEDLDADMRLSTIGIGAVLQAEAGYIKVVDVLPGSPAQADGRLKVNDRIVAIAEGKGKFVNLVGMRLDKALDLIRGKKGTTIRLQVIAGRAANSSDRKVVELVRNEVKLKDQEAKAEIIEAPRGDGQSERLGWITLPEFYGDDKGSSATRDVRALLKRLMAENITGLVMDLRQNGGGALDEAVSLTGLFINKGPVVQEKESDGHIYVSKSKDALAFYNGPMVVLTDHLTASASEIFAAAMQDYGRAVVIGGDRTFGKGTVQTVVELKDFIRVRGRKARDAGALQMTIAKFYRIAGGSTQLRGLVPDIKLPSPYDLPDEGETALKNPLPYDEIKPAAFKKAIDHPLFLSELRERSAARVAAEPEFAYMVEDLKRDQERLAANRVSLNEEARRAEMAAEKVLKTKRSGERIARGLPAGKIYQLPLDDVRKAVLQVANKPRLAEVRRDRDARADADRAKENDSAPAIDPVREETLRILSDLTTLSRSLKTASAQTASAVTHGNRVTKAAQ
jgi:carboxyl-terminal processing protease